MYGAWVEIWGKVKKHVPSVITKRRLNFISIHYIYLISVSIVGSIIIYPSGGIRYIDALFFASGSATQSGLNTVDINNMNTSQQLALYFLAMICNPIFIHSFVVFVRLYWFEKRFQHIVREATNLRRSKSRSRTVTEAREDPDPNPSKLEEGVNGRSIVVLHGDKQALDGAVNYRDEMADPEANAESLTSSNTKRDSGESLEAAKKAREEPGRIVTGDLVESPQSTDVALRVPQQLSAEQHIAFIENQRHPKDKGALRIPSPREFDRGGMPQTVSDEDGGGLGRHISSPIEPSQDPNGNVAKKADSTGPQFGNHITIDEPNIFRPKTRSTTFPRSRSNVRKPGTDANETDDPSSTPTRPRPRRGTFSSIIRSNSQEKEREVRPYLSWQPTIGRNSAFVDLTEDQREELGGIEYRALKTLAVVLVTYFIVFHVLGVICLIPWIMRSSTYGSVVTGDGQGRVWWGIFTAASAFNDLGFTLTPDSMISFGNAVFPMLLMTFLIIIGNTGFPCMLRFVIWVLAKIVPEGSGVWEELRFLLDHPRRCFTLLFPRGATWWLFTILVILNGLDLIFFIILDLNDPTVTSLSPGIRFIDGLFQASSTRTAGFSVVNLANLHPAIQVSYLIMMYISVFPIAISMRRTNVYEEKSLGIYGSKDDENEDTREPSYIGAHLRRQLSFDLWYVFLGLFVIAIVEGGRLQNTNDYSFTLFACLFEIVSAYGTVGLSLGYPNINASFSAEFKVLSKLVVIAMQIRGRHRGLPYKLDRAILLPSESLHKKELADAERRIRRRGSNVSQMSGVTGRNFQFRPETGLATGSDMQQARDRHSSGDSGEHQSHVRQGLGNAMYKLATHPEIDTSRRESR